MSKMSILRASLATLCTLGLTLNAAHREEGQPGAASGPASFVAGQSSTELPDGTVLLIGGRQTDGTPSAGLWVVNASDGQRRQLTAALAAPRTGHTATLLPDGSVLIVGGLDQAGALVTTPEVFRPDAETVAPLDPLPIAPRAYHTATITPDGRVLFAGGLGASGGALNTFQVWDPRGRRAVVTSTLPLPLTNHVAEVQPDGRIALVPRADESRASQAGGGQRSLLVDPVTGRVTDLTADSPQSLQARLVGSIPPDGAEDVALDATVALRLSDAVQVSTANATNVQVATAAGDRIDATVVPAEGGRLIFVTPRDSWRPEVEYIVTIADVVTRAGRAVAPAHVTFTAAADASDPEDWDPDPADAAGGWQTHRGRTQWQALPPLQAPPGVTALAGQALRLNGQPLARVRLSIDEHVTETDATGRFLLAGLDAGHHEMLIDGGPAHRAGNTYGVFEVGVDISAGTTTALDYTMWMTPLDTEHAVRIPSPTSSLTVVTTPTLPGLEFHVPAGTTITDHTGKAVRELSITAIPLDRPPFPLPRGVVVPIYFTIQPGAGYVQTSSSSGVRGGRLVYPNTFRQRPGTRFDFWNYDPEGRGWYVYGHGAVTADARQIVPDPGVEIYELTGAMVASPSFGPGSGPSGGGGYIPSQTGGDPVDLFTGLFVYSKTDLALPGAIPITLTRTYRQSDYISRAFGIGTTHPYDMFLVGDACPTPIPGCYTYADLVLADGGKVHFVRTSSGFGFVNAVFTHTATQSEWYAAEIRWNGNGWDLNRRDGMRYVFPISDSATVPQQAALTRIMDRFQNRIDIFRGTMGRVESIDGSDGRRITFTYDTSNRVKTAADNAGNVVSYDYDTVAGVLSQVTDVTGGVTKYSYDQYNEMSRILDPRGITYLTNDYGAGGRVTKQTMADGGIYKFVYSACGINCQRTDVTDPRGYVRRVTYNGAGMPTSDIEAVGRPEQRTTSYVWYPTTNLLQSVTNPLGHQTTFGYDPKGNRSSTTVMTGTAAAATTQTAYDTAWFSDPLTITDALSRITTLGYDQQHALASIKDPLNHTTTFTNNSLGQPEVVKNALQHAVTIAYDGSDVVGVTDPRGKVSTMFYDTVGRPLAGRDATEMRTQFDVNIAQRSSSVTSPDGHVTTTVYDENGNLRSVTDALGRVTTFDYDNMDRMFRRTDPLGRVDAVTFDLNGNVKTVTDRRGAVTTYTYDALNRPITVQVTVPGVAAFTRSASYTYDALDRLTEVVDSQSGTLTRVYNDVARTVTETTALGTTTWTVDAVGRRTSLAVSGQPVVTYDYDDADRLWHITQGTAVVTLGYDAANRRTSLTLPNGVTTEYTYDDASLLTGLTYKQGTTTLGTVTYDHDANGRRISASGSWARTALPAPVTAEYDAANQLKRWGTATIIYDAAGHLQSDGAQTYAWDGRGQLASVAGVVPATFTYDALGRRIALASGPTTRQFRYDGGNVVEERDGPGAVTATQLTGLGLDEVYQRTTGGAPRVPLVDGLGSTLAELDPSAAVTGQYSYGPFGQTEATGTSTLPGQWTGREADATGLYYHRARYYAPTFGRFLSEDPLGFGAGDVNLHAYAFSDPTNLTDPTGEAVPVLLAACAGGAAFDAGWQVVSNLLNRKAPGALDGIGGALARGCVSGLAGEGLGYALRYAVRWAGPALRHLVVDETGSIGRRALNGLGNTGGHAAADAGTALASAERWLGAGYQEIAPGVFRSADGLRQFRMTNADLLATHGTIGSHVHFEALDALGRVIENLHLPVSP